MNNENNFNAREWEDGSGNSNLQENADREPMSMAQWLAVIGVSFIPCAGLILYLIWAFSSNGNVNRKNYCRAMLIVQVIAGVLLFVFYGAIFSLFMSSYSGSGVSF